MFLAKKNCYSQNGGFFLHKQLHQNGVATFDPALGVDDPSELGIATGT
jgi:hypothetical protein